MQSINEVDWVIGTRGVGFRLPLHSRPRLRREISLHAGGPRERSFWPRSGVLRGGGRLLGTRVRGFRLPPQLRSRPIPRVRAKNQSLGVDTTTRCEKR